uniref:Uncharacterized protein n=1 Tax=Hydrogenovibrio crunogenus (strain DSM 25203 / XCL-2) TaxID=317025 RepID=Q31IU0_HYDCU
MSKSENPQLQSIKAQANTLHRLLNIQQHEALRIISKAFYHCASYEDLRQRIKDNKTNSRWFEIASISNQSSPEKLALFKKYVPIFGSRLSEEILCNTNRLGLNRLIYKIFNLTIPEDTLEHIFPSFKTTGWEALVDSEIAPSSILVNSLQLNNITYRLLAIRTFMPGSWHFDTPEHQTIAELLDPQTAEEFIFCKFSNDLLKKSVFEYISLVGTLEENDEDFDLPDFSLPFVALTNKEKQYQNLLLELLKITGDPSHNLDFYPTPMSLKDEQSTYLVFGYPIGEKKSTCVNSWRALPDKDPDNDSHTIILDKQTPVALERISIDKETLQHKGQYPEYFEEVRKLLSIQENFSYAINDDKKTPKLIFFRPATQLDIKSDLELEIPKKPGIESWTIKVTNSDFLERIINKIVRSDLFIYVDKYDRQKIICKLNLNTKNKTNISALLKISSSKSFTTINLIESTQSIIHTSNETTVYLTLNLAFLEFIKLINKNKIISSIRNGLINYVKEGTLDSIALSGFTRTNISTNFLPTLPKEESELLNSFDAFNLNLSSFFDNIIDNTYERDSF